MRVYVVEQGCKMPFEYGTVVVEVFSKLEDAQKYCEERECEDFYYAVAGEFEVC